MARISLLFSLAFVLAIGSVSAHPPSDKKTHKNLCPPTLSKLQAFPGVEIIKFIEKKAQSAPSIQYKGLFAFILAYNDHLEGKVGFGISIHSKYALLTKAMLRAQAFVGVKGKLAVKLSKSHSAMAEAFAQIVDKIAELSVKYKFDADAKISQKDRTDIDNCLIKLKGSIRVYLKVISACTKKFSAVKRTGISTGSGSLVGDFVNHGLGFAGEVGGKAGAKVGAEAGIKVGAKAGFKVATHAGAKVGGHAGGKIGAKGEAEAGGIIGGFFGRSSLGYGGNVQYDAAGKAKVGGGNGFRSLSHPHKKHLD